MGGGRNHYDTCAKERAQAHDLFLRQKKAEADAAGDQSIYEDAVAKVNRAKKPLVVKAKRPPKLVKTVGGYDRFAEECAHKHEKFLRDKRAEADALGDEGIYEEARDKIDCARMFIAQMKARFGSYTYYVRMLIRHGMDKDGIFDPRKNGTAKWAWQQDKLQAKRGKKKSRGG